MKIAAIADDLAILPALQAAELSSACEVVSVWGECVEVVEQMKSAAPAARVAATWDEILSGDAVDAVVVGGISEPVLAAARQFARQAGVQLLVVISPNAHAARTFDYTSIWQDAIKPVVPLFSSGVEEVATCIDRQFHLLEFGRLWKLRFERVIPMEGGATAVETETALQWFLQDSAWLRLIDPDSSHVTMTGTGPQSAQPIEMSILLSGEQSIDSGWTLRRGESPGWTLTLTGEHNELTVEAANNSLKNDGIPAALEVPQASDLVVHDLQRQLEGIAAGKPMRDWTDVIQLGEFGATAARSLVKRRTLPVHFEEASERSQFKSQMAAIGCGALLWTMFGMIALLTLAAVFDPRDREYLTSSSAGFVLRSDDFLQGRSDLTDSGREHLQSMIRHWSSTSPVVIIESQSPRADAQDQERLVSILKFLNDAKIRAPEHRVIVREIQGQWFEIVMLIGWIVVFAPVAIVLIAQLLIVVSRPIE